MERLAQLKHWLGTRYPGRQIDLAPASADASFRRYFRVHVEGEPTSFIAMDAPPEKEDTAPFIRIAKLFGDSGAQVPTVLDADTEAGFLLLTDLGDTTYLSALDADSAHALYADALGALICIQKASVPDVLPNYDRERLLAEMQLFPDWYLARHKHITLDDAERKMLDTVFERLLDAHLAEPKVFVHRDFHSRNLMVTEHGAGVLDFQDAVYGPITYDLASLFKDAYIDWDEAFVLDMLARYWEAARQIGLPVHADFAEFHRDFEWMGVQRHLKVLGIFARLCHRDGKAGYLDDMPRVSSYLRKACQRYSELRPLIRILNRSDPVDETVGYTF
ncbi:aminoglycoside phosphotransferase family protein [Denitromonas ohlonensis]|uniref:Phosphotransferase n=2 Tax=Denitromonas TaxID=139331 RepID=A0A557R5F5_9RHOO|nr:phosphotransferase [Denitromonas ohlonensis]TVO60377.1 phosphotransferase [Denitromonas ohlonensis]TVO78542.1 phosphotransferase [Denitromonas ohlonensis]